MAKRPPEQPAAPLVQKVVGYAPGMLVWVPDVAEVCMPGKVLQAHPEASSRNGAASSTTSASTSTSATSSGLANTKLKVDPFFAPPSTTSSDAKHGISTKPGEGSVTVRVGSVVRTFRPSQLQPRGDDVLRPDGLYAHDQLDELPFLHQSALLQTLQTRLHNDELYTYFGRVLLSMRNPARSSSSVGPQQGDEVAGLTLVKSDKSLMASYIRENSLVDGNRKPHIFGLAMAAFYQMYNQGLNQMILISGEQGSGKTENVKSVLKCLTYLRAQQGETGETQTSQVNNNVSQKMLSDANRVPAALAALEPLLEAFGNATTVRNRNSSCFGSLHELFYPVKARSHLAGGRFESYFFDKARVTEIGQGERTFHVFYQYVAALQSSAKDGYRYKYAGGGATNSCSYKFVPFEGAKRGVLPQMMSGGGVVRLEDQTANDELEEFDQTLHAMHVLGIPVADQESLFSMLTAILLLSCVASDAPGVPGAAKQVDERAMEMRLGVLSRILGIRNVSKLAHVCNNSGAIHSLGRLLYVQLWHWLLSAANEMLAVVPGTSTPAGEEQSSGNYATVSILDMFGFENFKKNGFEQLCTNFTHEVLTKYIFQDVHAQERVLYQNEGIRYEGVVADRTHDRYTNYAETTSEVVNFLRSGIFPVLEGLAEVDTSTSNGKAYAELSEVERKQKLDKLFCSRLRSQFGAGKNPRFVEKRTMSDTFAVKHFGGTEVTYSAQGFSWKNQDPYSVELYAFLKAESESAFLKKILGAGNNGETVLSPATKVLRSQLDRVMELVEGSERHFCICLNPNTRSVGGLFARNYVAEQLKAQGLLELVHAKRGGYPVRYTRAAFWAEFRALYPPGGAGGARKSAGAVTTATLLSTSQAGQKKSLTDRRPAAEASSPKDKATGASNLLNKGTTGADDNLLQSDFFARVAEKYESVKTAIDLGGECAVGTTTVFLTDVMLRALKGAMAAKNAYYATKVTATWRAGKTRTRFLYIMKGVRKIQRFVKGYQSLKTKRKFQHLIWLLHEKGAKPKAGINAGMQGKTSVLSAATTAEASAEETALEAEAREVSEERARLQQQKIDLMHAHEKEKAKMVLAEAEGEAAPFAFYIEGDDIVDGVGGGGGSGGSGRGGKNPGGARDVLTTSMQLLGDAVASSSDSKVKAAWDKLQGSLKQVLDEVEDAPKRTQYLLERQERELRKQAEQEKEHLMEVVKHKFGAMVDLTPEQAARRARQAISNIDLEFQCSKLKKDLAEITGGVDPDELFALNNTEEMFENFDFDRISPVWTERLVRNLRRTKKPLDVLILGPKNVGKTELIRRMYKTGGFDMPAAFINPKTGEEYSFATLGGRAQNAIREDPEHFLPDIVRHDFDYGGGFNLRILDCHARLSESSLYRRSLYSQAHWVFVVYTVTRQESVQSALALLQEAKKFNNNVLLLGNLIFESETVKATSRSMQRRVAAEAREVNLNYVKARADKHQGIVMETNELLTATKLAVESMMAPSEVVHYVPSLRTALEHSTQQPPEARRAEMRDAENELKEDVRKRIAGVADTDKPTVAEHEAENSYIRYPIAEAFDYNFMTLIPPAEDKGHQKLLRKAADPKRTGSPDGRLNYNDDAEGMQKLQQQAEEEDYDAGLDRDLILVEKRKPKAPAAVTCLAWGLEQRVKTFSFLVVGYKDGHIALYRMNHTKTDFELIHMESEQETGVEESTDYMRLVKAVGGQLKDEGAFSHVATWKGHKSAVTSVQFTSTEQRLITTSTDRTMRMWNLEQQHDHFVQHGHPHLQFVLEDAYAISCCCTVPAFPQLFVLANSCGNLRVGDYLTGGIVQKFSHMEEVRCLAIDKRQGNYLFGGTKFGELFVVDCERPGDFKFLPGLSLKLNQEWQGCTDMKFGSLPVVGSQPGYSRENEWGWQDLLVVNCADNSVVTAQVTYQRESNLILTMTVLHRYPNLQTVLPLRSCFSNHGFILTAGEDRHVHVHTIHNPQHVCSLLHDEPTVCVDLNRSHTMLATGDVMGNLYIWRVYEKQDPNAEGGEPGSRGEEPGSAANKGPASRGSEPRSSTGADGDGKNAAQAGPKSGGPAPSSSDGRGSKKSGSGSGSDSSKSSGKGKNNEPGTVAPGFGGGNSGSDSEMPANYRATTNEPGTMAAAFGGRASS